MSRYIVRVKPRSSTRFDDQEKYDGARPRQYRRNLSPRSTYDKKSNVLLRANRACDINPSYKDKNSKDRVIPARTMKAGFKQGKTDEYKSLLLEQYGFEPTEDVPSRSPPKVAIKRFKPKHISSLNASPTHPEATTQSSFAMSDMSTWHHVESPEDVQLYLENKMKDERQSSMKINCNSDQEKVPSFLKINGSFSKDAKVKSVRKEQTCADSSTATDVDWKFEEKHPLSEFVRRKPRQKEVSVQLEPEPKKNPPHPKTENKSSSIYISQIPTIKFIAEKFVRYKKDYVELRKLSEKIVCVEYDIFNQEDYNTGNAKPIKKMRAFFSIKPPKDPNDERGYGENITPLAQIPSVIKNKYNIADEDLKKLTEKEIEMIDETILENKAYLNDLKKILNRRQDSKNKTACLDLQYLYEMAKREHPPSDYDFSKLLTKSELDEVKDLILKRCVSSVHGISRRVVRHDDENKENTSEVISKNTIGELINRIS